MPKSSKQTASGSMTLEGYEGHFEELGGYTVGFETYAGTEIVEFSPTEPLQNTIEVVARNMEAASG